MMGFIKWSRTLINFILNMSGCLLFVVLFRRCKMLIKELIFRNKTSLRNVGKPSSSMSGGLIYNYCVQRGIHVTWEWSQSCQAWRLPMLQQLIRRVQPFFAVVRGCRINLRSSKGDFVSKGWKLMTTHQLLSKRMNLPCQCPPNVSHTKCEGSETAKTAYYTKEFAERVCKAVLQGLEKQDVLKELKGETVLVEGFGNGPFCLCQEGLKHEANLKCGSCINKTHQTLKGKRKEGSGCKGTPNTRDQVDSYGLVGEGDLGDPEVVRDNLEGHLSKEEIRRKLYLLHAATGHGPTRHLIQALRRRGVSARVLEEARKFECQVCKEKQRSQPRPRSSLEPQPPSGPRLLVIWDLLSTPLQRWRTNFWLWLMKGHVSGLVGF